MNALEVSNIIVISIISFVFVGIVAVAIASGMKSSK